MTLSCEECAENRGDVRPGGSHALRGNRVQRCPRERERLLLPLPVLALERLLIMIWREYMN